MKKICLLLAFFSLSLNASSQDKNDFLKTHEARKKEFVAEHVEDSFPPLGKWKTMNNDTVDFNKIAEPTFIRFGFRYCSPCRFEMPYFIEFAKNNPQVKFVYVTYDDFEEILEEVKEFNYKLPNLKFVSVKRTYIDGYRLTYGWPTNYFINKEGIIKHIKTGGHTSLAEITTNNFQEGLDAIK